MNLERFEYVELNLIGIALLGIMYVYLFNMHKLTDTKENKNFSLMLITNAAILLSDIIIILVEGQNSTIAMVTNNVFCIIYFVGHTFFSYNWFRYCVYILLPEYNPSRFLRFLSLVPSIFVNILVVFSPWSGLIYNITDSGFYQRGPLLWVLTFFTYLYWAFSLVLLIKEMIVQRRNRPKSLYLVLLIFPVPTIIGNIFQTNYYGITIIWICSAVSLLILFINFQYSMLNTDVLTGLSNRRQANNQIAWEISHYKKSYKLYTLILDVNFFKSINDKYGHIVGDRALKEVASILRESVPKEAFIGRFGGDEFVVIGHIQTKEDADEIVENIHKVAESFNKSSNEPFSLSFSIGCGIFQNCNNTTVDEIINIADKKMYEQKQNMKKTISQNQ